MHRTYAGPDLPEGLAARNIGAAALAATETCRLALVCRHTSSDLLAPLLSENIIFARPSCGRRFRARDLLVLTTVVQIFENFRYHRDSSPAPMMQRSNSAQLIGKWQLKGIDLITFNDAGEMIEFEVMIRPIKALQALGDEMGPDRPGTGPLKGRPRVSALIQGSRGRRPGASRLRAFQPCGKDRPALRGPFRPIPALGLAAVAQW